MRILDFWIKTKKKKKKNRNTVKVAVKKCSKWCELFWKDVHEAATYTGTALVTSVVINEKNWRL